MALNESTLLRSIRKTLPASWVERRAAALGVLTRRRKVDIVALVWTLALGFSAGAERSLASLRRAYGKAAGCKLVPSSFYDRLTPALTRLVREACLQAIDNLTGTTSSRMTELVGGLRELLLLDSTVVRLHRLLAEQFPATRTNSFKAAAKVHAVLALVGKKLDRVVVTPERTNDRRPWKRIGQWVKGSLLIFDLGYFSYSLFDRIEQNGGFFLSRLKSNSNPLVVGANRKWRGQQRKMVGLRLQDALVGLHRQLIDVMVEVTFDTRAYRGKKSKRTRMFRVIGIRNEQTGEYHLYITNLPVDRMRAADVGVIYSLRWQVELLFKGMKTHGRLHQIATSKAHIAEMLMWASVLMTVASQALRVALLRHVQAGRRIPQLRWAEIFMTYAPHLLEQLAAPRRRVRPSSFVEILLGEAQDPNVGRQLSDITVNSTT